MVSEWLSQLSSLSGTPVDYLKLFGLFLLSYPLAYPLPYLSPRAKHIANVVLSTFFLVPVMNLYSGYLQLLGTSLLTYVMVKYKVGGKRMPWLVFAGQMGHLTINHLVRHFGSIPLTTIEITAAQMVLVMNLTTFAWDCYDGRQRSVEQCDDAQKKTRIAEMPSILEFLGYAFYFPGVMIGPSTRFADYKKWADGSLFPLSKSEKAKGENGKPVVSVNGNGPGHEPRPPPAGRVSAALTELGVGLVFMAIYSLYSAQWDYFRLITPVAEGGVREWAWWKRIAFANAAGFFARTKYYAVWSLTNGACIMSGLGFYGISPDGKTKWNRCQNINIAKIEFANNWKELLDAWNMNTNVWLRNNVYKRLTRPGRKPGFKTTMATFLTSAFWHGVAPGYYVAFFLAGVQSSIARQLRRHVRPIFFADTRAPNPSFGTLSRYSPSQLVYAGCSIAAVQFTLNFTVAPFLVLDFGKSIAAYHSMCWYGAIMAFGSMVFFRMGGARWLDQQSGRVRRPRGVTSASDITDGDDEVAGSKKTAGEHLVPDLDAVEAVAKEAVAK
ncbi:MBOAT-domain-containing protein [Tilletiaria anomala UBC 951]|uniref:MBOAT-domain-containing protein n=1 Tax=Tilletiaria anomala (strain ATCC 24038 / CBS 436.72 / UBC 951) TaxID=1037660 RepID=A0A066V948_TILAU|nr:MBOAT-domain-containing protein [Tilletiaria anomala UBC 951]KDN37996.1 MBOAT-domain-containing protein [Tilletiaria anomala UBC 951]